MKGQLVGLCRAAQHSVQGRTCCAPLSNFLSTDGAVVVLNHQYDRALLSQQLFVIQSTCTLAVRLLHVSSVVGWLLAFLALPLMR